MTAEFIIIGISILPVLVLAIYIYRKDSKYPEPFNLLFKLFILGGFGSVLCALFLGSGISSFHISYNSPLLNALFTAFITAGLVEDSTDMPPCFLFSFISATFFSVFSFFLVFYCVLQKNDVK